MNTILVTLVIIFASLAAFSAAYLYLYKKNIKIISQKLDFIINNNTNILLTTDFSSKELNEMINLINSSLTSNKKMINLVKKTNKNFKNTIISVSHDLRTPLTSAGGYVQMLSNENISCDKKCEYIRIINERIKNVRKLLDQLFEYARIESNELELNEEKINIKNIFYDVISLYYQDYNNKNVEPQIIIKDSPYFIKGDEDAVRRIFSNIIYNSLVHGEDNYKIQVIENDDSCEFVFSNRSSTISESDMEFIFNRFYTSDKSRTKKTTGLGLSISQLLTEKMGGSIKASLNENVFSISIKLPSYQMNYKYNS